MFSNYFFLVRPQPTHPLPSSYLGFLDFFPFAKFLLKTYLALIHSGMNLDDITKPFLWCVMFHGTYIITYIDKL